MSCEVLEMRDYVEQREGGYWILGTRVSLDSVVYGFLRGQCPESIQSSFPALTLEEIYGAITYYLGNRSVIDEYLKEGEEVFEKERAAAALAHPELHRRLAEARRSIAVPRA